MLPDAADAGWSSMFSLHFRGGKDDIERRTLTSGVSGNEGSRPDFAQLKVRPSVVLPDSVGVDVDEAFVRRSWMHGI